MSVLKDNSVLRFLLPIIAGLAVYYFMRDVGSLWALLCAVPVVVGAFVVLNYEEGTHEEEDADEEY